MNSFSYNNDISKNFSATFLMGLIDGKKLDFFLKIINESGFFNTNEINKLKIKDILDKFYLQLLQHYRNEYVYKNLLIKHINEYKNNNQNYSLISEIDVGINSRVDLSIFDHTNSAFEIKTELDNTIRLNKQLDDYAQGFEYVWVLISESKINKISSQIDKRFGIKYLDNNNKIHKIREASSNLENITHAGLYSLLRQQEFFQLLKKHYGHIPDVKSSATRKKLIEMFKQIDTQFIHKDTVNIIKYRTNHMLLRKLFNNLPKSLLPLSLSTQIQKEKEKFFNFLNTDIEQLTHHKGMMQHGKLF